MIYALSFVVLLSPIFLFFFLTSEISRRKKVMVVLLFAAFLVIFPIAAFWFGLGSGL